MRVYVSKSFKLAALALTLNSRHGSAYHHAPSAGDVLMRGRIARPILGAAAAGAVIATFGLAAAGTAGAATGPVRVVHGHPVAGNGTASGSTAAGTAGAAAGSVRVFYNNHQPQHLPARRHLIPLDHVPGAGLYAVDE